MGEGRVALFFYPERNEHNVRCLPHLAGFIRAQGEVGKKSV